MNIPNLLGLCGVFGSGKSLYMLELGLAAADKYKKPLVCNFRLRSFAIRKYCKMMGFGWFAKFGRIIHVNIERQGLCAMLRPNSVVLFDEVGYYVNARNWSKLPTEFSRDLFQLRHLDIHLILAFQFIDQIDKNLRECCQQWVICEGLSVYSNKLQMPRLLSRYAYHFELSKFIRYCDDPKIQSSTLRKWVSALKVRYSFLFMSAFIADIRTLLSLLKCLLFFLKTRTLKFKVFSYQEKLLFDCYSSSELLGHDYIYNSKNKVINVSYSGSIPRPRSRLIRKS